MHFSVPLRPFLILASLLGLAGCGEGPQGTGKKKNADEPPPVVKEVNRLSLAKSPFLKRHEADPVDWFPWGPEAFKKAKDENKLVMVCIGYSSCPWTLRMQKETYTDQESANFINRHFVNVLVDREDQPDINNTFLRFTFMVTRKSGWPLHVWLTPSGLPVHTAIYLPKSTTELKQPSNLPTFMTTVQHVAQNWRSDSDYVNREADLKIKAFRERLRLLAQGDGQSKLDRPTLDLAFDKLAAVYDPSNGGFSGAPRFHQATTMDFLLDYARIKKDDQYQRGLKATAMVTSTLDHICRGALRDHLAGGFHRYCQDVVWAVPQFEKMLYDQGYMTLLLLRMHQITGEKRWADLAKETLAYVLSELNHPEGGFYCAENSFSPRDASQPEFVEGASSLWRIADVETTVGPDLFPVAKLVFDLGPDGNLPIESLNLQETRYRGQNILREARSMAEVAKNLNIPQEQAEAKFAEGKAKLLTARRLRPRPPLDGKVLPCWNGVVISALTWGSAALQQPEYLQRAEKAANFTVKAFTDANYPRRRYAEDYALLIQSLLDLYEVTGGASWLKTAHDLQKRMDDELWDTADGGYWDGPDDPNLFVRMKSADEANEFAPNAVAALNLLRFGFILSNQDDIARATNLFRAFAGQAAANPSGGTTPAGPAIHVRLLKAYEHLARPGWQFLLVGDPAAPALKELKDVLLQSDRPNSYLLHLDGKESQELLTAGNPELAQLAQANATPAVICARRFQAEKTITSPAELKAFIKAEF